MGGIADYSGSLVLQMPIQEAAIVALQRHPERDDFHVVSLNAEAANRSLEVQFPMSTLWDAEQNCPISYSAAKDLFAQDYGTAWAAYVAGCLIVLGHEKGLHFTEGVRILLQSKVPEGKGVSSSAAVEVASMQAISAAYEIPLEGRELAMLCQKVENLVVGAPCGIMDQMASALGKQGKLLALLCRPAEVQGYVTIPESLRFWGLDSGVRHSVGGSDYSSVRCGTFMGLTLLKEGGLSLGNLTELSPSLFMAEQHKLPTQMLGKDFVSKCSSHGDSVTTINDEKVYAIANPTNHAVQEHFRVTSFRGLLEACRDSDGESIRPVLGELMLQSHASYSACALGSEGTNSLVDLVRGSMPTGELFGAKITGGGSGGTVCVLGAPNAVSAIEAVVDAYHERNGYRPYVFRGSSPGAVSFGHLKVKVQ